MSKVLDPFQFVIIALAGWLNHRQYQLIDYLREENRVLREQLGERRPGADSNTRGSAVNMADTESRRFSNLGLSSHDRLSATIPSIRLRTPNHG